MSAAPTADPARDHSRITNHVLVPSAGVHTIDPVHTFVGFVAQHLVVGRVHGRFERVVGTVTIAEVLGELTVRGVAKPVPLTVHFAGSIVDSSDRSRVAFHASGTVTRSDVGLVAEPSKEAGGMLIGDDFILDIDAEATQSQ